MRWRIPAVILLVLSGAIARFYLIGHASRQVLAVVLTILALVLLLLWYLLFAPMSRRRRFLLWGATIMGAIVVVGGGRETLRWKGSVSGGAVPLLVWRWSEEPEASLAPLEPSVVPEVVEEEESYPKFLGPDGDGVIRGVALEQDWEAHPPRELWRRRIGLGWSGFAVANGRALTQEQRGENELVVAYALRTGEPLWAHENGVGFRETLGGDGPRATPAIFNGRVYAMGATGIVIQLLVMIRIPARCSGVTSGRRTGRSRASRSSSARTGSLSVRVTGSDALCSR